MPAWCDFSTRCTQDIDSSTSSGKKRRSSVNQGGNDILFTTGHGTDDVPPDAIQEEQKQLRAGDWARVLEAATQRRTEILMPENLENMWSKGRNYKMKEAKRVKGGEVEEPLLAKSTGCIPISDMREFDPSVGETNFRPEEKALVHRNLNSVLDTPLTQGSDIKMDDSLSDEKELFLKDNHEDALIFGADGKRTRLKRSSSTSALKVESASKDAFKGEVGGTIISEFYNPSLGSRRGEYRVETVLDVVYRSEGPHTPNLRCRVRKTLLTCWQKKPNLMR